MATIERLVCRYRTLILLLAICTLLFGASSLAANASENVDDAATVEVTASVDKNDVTIGDKIKLVIQVKWQGNVNIKIPDLGDSIGEFSVKNAGETKEIAKEKDGSRIVERSYILSSYRTGLQTIPSMKIGYKEDGSREGVAVTDEIEINIKGILTEGEEAADIRDIAPPVDVDKNYKRLFQWISTGVAAILLCFSVYWLLKKRKKAGRVQTEVVKKLPHEKAYELLEILSKENLIEQGLVKEYYYRITNILRHYIEDRFGLSAPERTTEEFLVEMAYTNKLNNEHKKLIQVFLGKCDMVKYAKYGPSLLESKETYHLAKRLIDETKAELEEKKEEVMIVEAK
ncbi:MAG: protein BatD [Candidatus Kuenenia sp.]|nr:protein BatD [Candidatus Kuenenia hertensis]